MDIVADRDTPVGPEIVLVRCKRNAPQNKVGEPAVKQLAMEVDDQRATRGLIVIPIYVYVGGSEVHRGQEAQAGALDGAKPRETTGRACNDLMI